MRSLVGLTILAAAIAAIAVVAGAPTVALADTVGLDGGPVKGQKTPEVVVKGTIVSIAEDGALLVIDRGDLDEDPADDVKVKLTEKTKIVPADATPAEGDLFPPPEVKKVPLSVAQLKFSTDDQRSVVVALDQGHNQ